MTEWEICFLYRGAKNKRKQLQILAELACRRRIEIVRILLKNGEKLPTGETKKLYKRLEVLDKQISDLEKEYREIVNALTGGKKKETEQEE